MTSTPASAAAASTPRVSGELTRERRVALLLHPIRSDAVDAAAAFVSGVAEYGVCCCLLPEQLSLISQRLPTVQLGTLDGDWTDVELMVVFGGDGTILRAAEWALPHQVPLLGVNLGHVGFLAEMDVSEIGTLIRQVAERRYEIEQRLTLDVNVLDETGQLVWSSFAVNEVSTEKVSREKMADLLVTVDHRPLSRWACDGVLVSTASGSTAYAFSVGGPVMWPDVEAFEVCPIAAHALFARPLVVAPDSLVELHVMGSDVETVVVCDGRRTVDVLPGSRISVRRHDQDLRIARLSEQPFTTRLVKKFELNIEGWRSNQGPATTLAGG